LVPPLGFGVIRWQVRFFGIPVVSLERTVYEFVEDDGGSRIEGGSAHNFERDVNPITPEDRYGWEWEDGRGFGFGSR